MNEEIEKEHCVLDEDRQKRSFSDRYFGVSWSKFLSIAGFVVATGVYLGILLFGDNSLEVLLDLVQYREYQESEIELYQNENAILQKEYFEDQALDADYKDNINE